MDIELQPLKPYLPEYLQSITRRHANGKYDCFMCGSGTGKNKTAALSVDPDSDNTLWKCFACQRGGDIVTAVSLHEGISRGEAVERVKEMYGNRIPAQTSAQEVHQQVKSINRNYSKYITDCANAIKGSPAEDYLHGRGFTDETITRFNIGYDATDGGKIVVPYNRECTYFFTRNLMPHGANNFRKPKKSEAGIEPIYNAAALRSKARAVFVTESQLDAITLMQEGAEQAIAMGGLGVDKLKQELEEKGTKAILLLCLDNDDAGRSATASLQTMLDAVQMPADCPQLAFADVSADICGTDKDPNEVLQNKRTDMPLRERIKRCLDEITKSLDAVDNQSEGESAIDRFINSVQTRRYEPIPTRIKDLDTIMNGGFMRQSLYFLGGAPGVGKTAFAQWLFETMATYGTECIYLNLEMSQEQMLARSLSRIVARQGAHIKPSEILQGYKWSEERKKQIEKAAIEYKATIAPYLTYNPSGVDNSMSSIMQYLEAVAKRAEEQGQQAPVICIDYLQIIRGSGREEAGELIKQVVDCLKRYAIAHRTFVLVIMAHNRETNKNGTPTMNSGRDTSAIEYSADAQLALTFTACLKSSEGGRGCSAEEVPDAERKNLTLKFVKGRNGEQGKYVHLHFDGATMTYTQVYDKDRPSNSNVIRV